MNMRDRNKLAEALASDMLPGFTTEEYDDFVNYAPDGVNHSGCRVLRAIGPGRILMLFAYDDDYFKSQWSRPEYRTYFLNENNDLVEFDPKVVVAEWRSAHNKVQRASYSWDKVVGGWLAEQGARQFKGRGWTADCAMKMHNLIRRWIGHYDGGSHVA